MKNNRYKKEMLNYLQIMNEALTKDDFEVFEEAKGLLEETVDERKNECSLIREMDTTNFGILNHIFEEALPSLLKSNKKAVRAVIKTIKEDKNLMAEFNFYNLVNSYNSKISEIASPEDVFKTITENVLNKINKKGIVESNKKLKKVMFENNIIPISHVNKDDMNLYEAGHYILSKTPTMTNVYEMYSNKNDILKYMESRKDLVVEEKVSPEKLIRDFEDSLKEKLTESEISFVQQITDFRSPIAEQRKEKLFNKFKNECIDKVNEMLKENSDNNDLKALKKQLEEQKFNNDTIVKDMAKLLEIRDILLDK